MRRGNDPQPQRKMRHLRSIETPQPFFRNKKSQVPYLQILVFLPHLSSSPDLRILNFVLPSRRSLQWLAFALHKISAFTVAVPSGICTRFSILLRGCYHIRRHSNGIFTCTHRIPLTRLFVNRKIGPPLVKLGPTIKKFLPYTHSLDIMTLQRN